MFGDDSLFGSKKPANKRRIETGELQRLTYELERMEDAAEQELAEFGTSRWQTARRPEANVAGQKRKRRFIESGVNGVEPRPVLPSVVLFSASENRLVAEESKQETTAKEKYDAYLSEVYKGTPKINEIDLSKVPYYRKNAKIIEKLKAKRAKEQEKLREAREEAKRKEEARRREEMKRREEAKAREEQKAREEARQREEQKVAREESKAADSLCEMARRYYAFRVHVNSLVPSKKLTQDQCTNMSDFLNQTFNSLTKKDYQSKIRDIINFYNTVASSKNGSLEECFVYTITKVLYPQIKENSKITARDNVGRDMITIYAQIFTQMSALVPGLVNYMVSFCLAKCPLLIPDVHPLGVPEQEYRIRRGYRDSLPPGQTKRFNDSMKFRGKRLKGMAIFYCSLVKLNLQYLSQAWTTLCKLLNSHAVNHTPVLIDVLIFELGDLFMRHYGVQYKKILLLIKGEYAAHLRAEAGKFGNESEIFGQKIDSLLYVVQDQLIKCNH